MRNRLFCNCISTPDTQPIRHLVEELVEFVKEPSAEEASDIMFAVGRLLAALIGKVYIRVPGDGRCFEKLQRRYLETGCVRSLRHRPAGVCEADLLKGESHG